MPSACFRSRSPARRAAAGLCVALASAWAGGCSSSGEPAPRGAAAAGAREPLRVVVMDPLAEKLTGNCHPSYGQRKYDKLAAFLAARLARPVVLAHSEALRTVLRLNPGRVHLIVGKRSIVAVDAAAARIPVRPLAMLTGLDGATSLRGLFVVRADDPARSLADLAGRRILFGPAEDTEKHAAALTALSDANVPPPASVRTSPACSTAALAVIEREADAAVVSSYRMPLLVSCGVVKAGELRVIGQTAPVPFVTVFATSDLSEEAGRAVRQALLAVAGDAALLKQMESARGFVAEGAGP